MSSNEQFDDELNPAKRQRLDNLDELEQPINVDKLEQPMTLNELERGINIYMDDSNQDAKQESINFLNNKIQLFVNEFNPDEAIKLIRILKPEDINPNLISKAIAYNLQRVVLELIRKGIHELNQMDYTFIMIYLMDEIFLELTDRLGRDKAIEKLGKINMEKMDKLSDTLLMIILRFDAYFDAYRDHNDNEIKRFIISFVDGIRSEQKEQNQFKIRNIVNRLIDLDQIYPDYQNREGYYMYNYVVKNQFPMLMEPRFKPVLDLDCNQQDCLDLIMYDTLSIREFLQKDPDNVIFASMGEDKRLYNVFGNSIETIYSRFYLENDYKLYECIKANDKMNTLNVDTSVIYINTKTYLTSGDVVEKRTFKQIKKRIRELRKINKQGLSEQYPIESRIFILFPLRKRLESTIGVNNFNEHLRESSSRHCQEGQDATVYELFDFILSTDSLVTPERIQEKEREENNRKEILKKDDSLSLTPPPPSTAFPPPPPDGQTGGYKTKKNRKRKNQSKQKKRAFKSKNNKSLKRI